MTGNESTNGNGKKNGEPDNIVSKVLKIAAYPLGGFSGWWVTKNQIRHYTFQKLKARGGLHDVIETHENGRLQKEMFEALEHIRNSDSPYDLKTKSIPLENEYTEAIRERMKKLGLNGIKNQSEYIYKPQFHKALLEGFTAATIAIGGLLIIANSKSLTRAFNDLTDKDEAKQRS